MVFVSTACPSLLAHHYKCMYIGPTPPASLSSWTISVCPPTAILYLLVNAAEWRHALTPSRIRRLVDVSVRLDKRPYYRHTTRTKCHSPEQRRLAVIICLVYVSARLNQRSSHLIVYIIVVLTYGNEQRRLAETPRLVPRPPQSAPARTRHYVGERRSTAASYHNTRTW